MPLTLTISEGVIPNDTVKSAVQQLTDSMLKWHALTGNAVMTPNVTANVHIVPKGHSFSGGEQPREHIYFNVVHTVDGAWNLDGRAMSNEELGQAIAKG